MRNTNSTMMQINRSAAAIKQIRAAADNLRLDGMSNADRAVAKLLQQIANAMEHGPAFVLQWHTQVAQGALREEWGEGGGEYDVQAELEVAEARNARTESQGLQETLALVDRTANGLDELAAAILAHDGGHVSVN